MILSFTYLSLSKINSEAMKPFEVRKGQEVFGRTIFLAFRISWFSALPLSGTLSKN